MSNRVQAVALAAALLLAVPVGAARAQTSPEDAAAIGAYRLTMPAMEKSAAVNRALVEELKKDPRTAEHTKLSAELRALQTKDETTPAEDERVREIRARLAVLANEGATMKKGAKTLKDMEAAIQGFPPMAAALRTAGIEPREYTLLTLAMMQAGFAAALKESNPNFDTSKLTETQLANIKFIQENQAELKRLRSPAGQ